MLRFIIMCAGRTLQDKDLAMTKELAIAYVRQHAAIDSDHVEFEQVKTNNNIIYYIIGKWKDITGEMIKVHYILYEY